MKKYALPEDIHPWIEKYVRRLGFDLDKPKSLSPWIMKISDHYQSRTSITNWREKGLQAAYLSYFFPLNFIRTQKVIDEARHYGFFEGLKEAIDYGCGPGTITKALLDCDDINISKITGIDREEAVGKFYLDTPRRQTELSFSTRPPGKLASDVAVFISYTLNELTETPEWLFQSDNIMAIEPSTRQNFEKMNRLRTELIEKGYKILAPCPHHLQCPLSHSKKDWCHDRVHWEMPSWFEKLEQQLPIKNRTLTFSYIIASKMERPKPSYNRIVSDSLVEKGKTRWMICRKEEREFLSFLKRQGNPPTIERGERVKIEKFEKKGQEIRFEKEDLEHL